jgi:hypothetical protein
VPFDQLRDHYFKQFVDTSVRHVVSQFGGSLSSRAGADAGQTVPLVFVRVPLLRRDGKKPDEAPGFRQWADASADIYRLESPWLSAALTKDAGCLVGARFMWNERQFLLDQALLAGGSPAHSQSSPEPFSDTEFVRYTDDYVQSVLLAPSPQAAARQTADLSARIPPELLWLYQHAWQSTRGPFSALAIDVLNRTIEEAAGAYAELVLALLDGRIASRDPVQAYRSVLDLRPTAERAKYRIIRLH